MRLFGYARVSTSKQCLDLQKEELRKSGVDDYRIWSDTATGKTIERAGLQMLLIKVEKGDKIVVTALDRLGRNTIEMCQIISELTSKGVEVYFLRESLSTAGPMGNLMITIISAIAQSERERIVERTTEGRIDAMKKGVKFGPKFKVDRVKLIQMIKEGKTAIEISKEMKIARGSVYNIVKKENIKVQTVLQRKLAGANEI